VRRGKVVYAIGRREGLKGGRRGGAGKGTKDKKEERVGGMAKGLEGKRKR
jgi:hypothetical protein